MQTHEPDTISGLFPALDRTQRLYERVVHHLVRLIVQGTIRPGESLPAEPELAERFGVSRTVVREAVRVLVAKGLIAVKHGSGMRVRPLGEWDRLDPEILFERVRVSHDETLLREIFEVRRLLELEVAALAALRRTADDLLALRTAVDGMREGLASDVLHATWGDSASAERIRLLDVAFHRQLAIATGNRLLQQMVAPIIDVIRVRDFDPPVPYARMTGSQRGHERILAAVERGDAEGSRSAMRAHLDQFEQDVRSVFTAEATLRPS